MWTGWSCETCLTGAIGVPDAGGELMPGDVGEGDGVAPAPEENPCGDEAKPAAGEGEVDGTWCWPLLGPVVAGILTAG